MAENGTTAVVGFNGTEHARRAALRAAELAGREGRLIVVVVIEPSQAIGARIEDIEPHERTHSRELVSQAQALLRSTGVTVEIEERIGDPAEEIVRASEERAADVIAVGRGEHRLEPLRRRVWDRVVRDASLPVIVVP